MNNKIDVLLVARPDHSMQIYKALLDQNELESFFVTFKVFPEWIKRITGSKKMTTISDRATCSWLLTIADLCRYKFKFRFAQSWDETHILDKLLKKILKKNDIHIIHYWPEYGDVVIQNYVQQHAGVRAFADIHMAHPVAVFESMKPVYQKYGIAPETTQLAVMAKEQGDFAGKATDILVPSSYVADTYKAVYEGKRYHVVSYGITVSQSYQKHQCTKVSEFVYAGRISLEKGSDLLLEYFTTHPEYNIHLYGGIIRGQEAIFEPYKKYKNIIFHGSVPKAELQEHMKHFHAGIHMSRFDAYSLAVGEMIGCGLPVIVSDHTGNKDDVVNEGLGVVAALTKESLETAVSEMCNLENYTTFIENIDNFIIGKNLPYGVKMVNFYKHV